MLKNKKLFMSIALIAILIASMFILTGCGDNQDTSTQETNGGSQGTTANSGSSEEQNTVIQVQMAVANMYPNTTITQLYLSGAGQDNWGSDLLGGQTMPTGTQLPLTFNIDKNNVKWDIKAVDETGVAVEFRNLDLSNVSTSGGTITLTADESGAPVAVAQ